MPEIVFQRFRKSSEIGLAMNVAYDFKLLEPH